MGVGAVSRPVKLYLAVCRSRAEDEQLGSGGLDEEEEQEF